MWLLTFTVLLEAVAIVQALPIDDEVTSERAGFSRFTWVTNFLRLDDRLARSSAPHYRCQDCDQRFTPDSIKFLKHQNIEHIISLNSEANNQAIKDELRQHNIHYTPLPIGDFNSPTLDDVKKAYNAFNLYRKAGTLVYCGYGHGRTGTLITALQIYTENQTPWPTRLLNHDYKLNHVETSGQMKLLDSLQDTLAAEQVAKNAANGLSPTTNEARVGKLGATHIPDQKTKPPKRPSKLLDMAKTPSRKPSAKTPKLMADSNTHQTISKPSRQLPKEFDHTMGSGNSGVKMKTPGLPTWRPQLDEFNPMNIPGNKPGSKKTPMLPVAGGRRKTGGGRYMAKR